MPFRCIQSRGDARTGCCTILVFSHVQTASSFLWHVEEAQSIRKCLPHKGVFLFAETDTRSGYLWRSAAMVLRRVTYYRGILNHIFCPLEVS